VTDKKRAALRSWDRLTVQLSVWSYHQFFICCRLSGLLPARRYTRWHGGTMEWLGHSVVDNGADCCRWRRMLITSIGQVVCIRLQSSILYLGLVVLQFLMHLLTWRNCPGVPPPHFFQEDCENLLKFVKVLVWCKHITTFEQHMLVTSYHGDKNRQKVRKV